MPWKCQTRSLKRQQAQGKKHKAVARQQRVHTPGRKRPTSAQRCRCCWGLEGLGGDGAQISCVSCVCQRVSVSKNTLWKQEISWQVIEMSSAGKFSISAVDHWELHRYRVPSASCKGWKWADALPCNGVVQSVCGYKKEHPLIFQLGKALGKPTSQSPLMHIRAFIFCWMGCLKKDHELRVVPLLQGPLHHCFLAFLSGQQRRTGIPFDSQGQ